MGTLSFATFKRLVLWLAAFLLLALLATVVSAKELDLSKAVRVGNGRIMVIEFTDPDCPFCRKAEAYFQKRSDVTRYIFFIPLKSHPASKGKVQYILSAKDKERAYLEVANGSLDKWQQSEITPEGIALQQAHEQIAKEQGLNATPIFIVYGRVVRGFDLKKLEPLLK